MGNEEAEQTKRAQMTAIKEFQRLEATGLWRAQADSQRREVIVSLGDATLVMTTTANQALAHWSLAAIERANPGALPAIFHPHGDPGETLELPPDSAEMVEAIEKLHRVVERRRPRQGRLRLVLMAASLLLVVAALTYWLPDAAKRHTLTVVPEVKRNEIGAHLLTRIERVSGPPCAAEDGQAALRRMARRLLGPVRMDDLIVLRGGVRQTAHLPNGQILLNRSLVEDPEEPEITAGYILAEDTRREITDPLAALLDHAGLVASLRLLTTGKLSDAALDDYARHILTLQPARIDADHLLRAFDRLQISSRPYAFAVDPSGETTLELIEANPHGAGSASPVVSDGDWLRLQAICGG